jgi:colanic acid/amylovoran biosynthesis protein
MPSEPKFRVAILGATLQASNMGVAALAAGAIRWLDEAYPDAEICFLDYAKEPSTQILRTPEGKRFIGSINIRFSKRIYLPNNIALLLFLAALIKLIPSRRIRDWVLTRNRALSQIYSIDLFASVAGGDSFSDIYGIGRFVYVSLPQILVLLLGKKLVLLPQTLGPYRSRFSRMIARYILRRADRIYSRDQQGLSLVDSLGAESAGKSRTAFCPDVAFLLDAIAPACIDLTGLSESAKRRPLVGLNVSGLLLMGGYTHANMFGLNVNYEDLVKEIIRFVIEEKSGSVLLIPHVFGADPESDVRACEQVYAKLQHYYPGSLGLLRSAYNQNEIKYIIGQCDVFVGARMHACIAAVSQGIPTVCVAYSDKFIGVMEGVRAGSIVLDGRDLNITEAVKLLGRSIDERAAIRDQLREKMMEIKKTVLSLSKQLRISAENCAIRT